MTSPAVYHQNSFEVTHGSCPSAHDVQFQFAGTNEPKRMLNKPSKEHNTSAEHSLVHCYKKYVTVYHVTKCMSYDKAIVVMAGREHGLLG